MRLATLHAKMRVRARDYLEIVQSRNQSDGGVPEFQMALYKENKAGSWGVAPEDGDMNAFIEGLHQPRVFVP